MTAENAAAAKSRRMTPVLFLAILLSVSAAAQCESSLGPLPRADLWVPNGLVNDIRLTPDTVYIAGKFTSVGPYSGHGVLVTKDTGQECATYPKIDEEVKSSLSDGAGGWFILGKFTQVDNKYRRHIAHILANGTVDPNWNPGVEYDDNNFTKLVGRQLLYNGTLYLMGNFYQVGGEYRNGFAAIDAATGHTTSWNPNVDARKLGIQEMAYYSMQVYNGKLYVSYEFTKVDGQRRISLAAFDLATGLLDSWDPNAGLDDDHCYKNMKILHYDGTLCFAGNKKVNDPLSEYFGPLFIMDPATRELNPWPAAANCPIALHGFLGFYGQTGVVVDSDILNLFDMDTGVVDSFSLHFTGSIYSISACIQGPILYVGGELDTVEGNIVHNAIAVDLEHKTLLPWNPNLEHGVRTLSVSGDNVFAGGTFISSGAEPRNYIASIDRATGTVTNWAPTIPHEARYLALSDDYVYVSGSYDVSQGGSLEAFDIHTGVERDWHPQTQYGETLIIPRVYNHKIYIGGVFQNINSYVRKYLTAFNEEDGSLMSWNPTLDGPINAVETGGNILYVSGDFHKINGQTRNYLASFNLDTGLLTSWNPDPDRPVNAIAPQGNTVFVVGSFTHIGGAARNGGAEIDATTGRATAWNPNLSSAGAVAVNNASVVVGPSLTIGGMQRRGAGEIERATGLPTPWGLQGDSRLIPTYYDIWHIAMDSQSLFLGGCERTLSEYPVQTGPSANPPTGTVIINQGAETTSSSAVTLSLAATSATDGDIVGMQFSNDKVLWSDWKPFYVTAAWTLPSGEGTAIVYTHYMDIYGNISTEEISDGIVIDLTPPSISIGNPSTLSTVNGPVTFEILYAGADHITLGPQDVELVKHGDIEGDVIVTGAGVTSRTVTLSNLTGSGIVAIRLLEGTASDLAGNLAGETLSSAYVVVNTTAPACSPAGMATMALCIVLSAVATRKRRTSHS